MIRYTKYSDITFTEIWNKIALKQRSFIKACKVIPVMCQCSFRKCKSKR